MKLILNKTRNGSDRLTLIDEGMGGAGDPPHYPTHNYSVADGVDRGSDYQGYSSITYFLKEANSNVWIDDELTQEAKNNLIDWLIDHGYRDYLVETGCLLPE